LGLSPNLELPDNSKLTTHVSKYTREGLSSFSSLANSISSYDQEVRADSPSSCASDESELDIGILMPPVHIKTDSVAILG